MQTYMHPHKQMSPQGGGKIEQKFKKLSSGSEIQNRQRIFTSTVVVGQEVPNHCGKTEQRDKLCPALL